MTNENEVKQVYTGDPADVEGHAKLARYLVLNKYHSGDEWTVSIATSEYRAAAERFKLNIFAFVRRVMVDNDGQVICEFSQIG